jgi:hypothetical protein
MLKRARGKFRGKLARRQLLREGGGLSRESALKSVEP